LQKRHFSLTKPLVSVNFWNDFNLLLLFLIRKVEVILMQEYEDLKVLVAEIEADIDKAEGGNKAAGTRVRKQMQRIKQAAQLVRNSILEIRSAQ
jgi:hypothetical protein